MSIFTKKKNKEMQKRSVVFAPGSLFDEICCSGYTPISQIPEVVACARKIAELIGSATIHLMANTEDGDERIVNELSRLIDIEPMPNMTRSTWMEGIVMTMLLYGKGNAIVQPHTWQGYFQSLEPISADRVNFECIGYRDYKVLIDGQAKNPKNLMHFVYNPDRRYLWKGTGVTVAIRDVLDNLVQARSTEKAFMSSEYKPAVIIRVDSMIDDMSDPVARQAIIDSYIKPQKAGEPWMIPAEQFDVQQVRPLTLADLAISDSVTLNKRMIAAIFGVPAFIVGIGEYKRDEWNTFIQTKIMSMAKSIAAEMTKKLILNPKWYLTFNVWSLMDYDLKTVSEVLLAGSDRGFVNGDEYRNRVHLNPAGLKEYRVLENFIPVDMAGLQKKLIQPGEE
ncbi:MAG: phage portal protein [Lachnospiraceae bacterium]|nr:phage portal protein [Lachnospiraceae bacterium]